MRAFFGGPDKPPGLLRDILAERIELVPSGGEILWATYYFRDLDLAESLIRARRRGVTVRLCLEATPRMRTANDAVSRRLAAPEGLGDGFRSISHWWPAHLHEKLYIFSHPKPSALVGSYNPSGAGPDDVAIIREIGDQDRGHNYLVEIDDETAVGSLRLHLLSLFASKHHLLQRFRRDPNEVTATDAMRIFYFPRRDSGVLVRLLTSGRFDSIRIAASHFRDSAVVRCLAGLVRTGTSVEVIAHDTQRRVPRHIEALAGQAGIGFTRYRHPAGLPMHNKFILLSAPDIRRVLFGSMNLTLTSRLLNHELLVAADDPVLFAAFDNRWAEMCAEIAAFSTEQADDAKS